MSKTAAAAKATAKPAAKKKGSDFKVDRTRLLETFATNVALIKVGNPDEEGIDAWVEAYNKLEELVEEARGLVGEVDEDDDESGN